MKSRSKAAIREVEVAAELLLLLERMAPMGNCGVSETLGSETLAQLSLRIDIEPSQEFVCLLYVV